MRELDGPMPPDAPVGQLPLPADGGDVGLPPSPWDLQRPPRRRLLKPLLMLIFIGLPLLGFAVQTIREAKATPNDKAACNSVLTLITSDPESDDPAPFIAMVEALRRADDGPLTENGTKLTQAIQGQDFASADQALVSLSDRCQDISSDYDDRLQRHCDARPAECSDRGFSLF